MKLFKRFLVIIAVLAFTCEPEFGYASKLSRKNTPKRAILVKREVTSDSETVPGNMESVQTYTEGVSVNTPGHPELVITEVTTMAPEILAISSTEKQKNIELQPNASFSIIPSNDSSDIFYTLPKSLQESLLSLKTSKEKTRMLKIISKFYEGDGPTLFTLTNTEIGRSWDQIPYREKFQWSNPKAPCHTFTLAIPDERDAHGVINLCIYRRHLITKEVNSMIVHEGKNTGSSQRIEHLGATKIYGHVVDNPGSSVYGHFVQGYFYGEVSMKDPMTHHRIIYVVEEIKSLVKLLRASDKIMHNLLVVMNSGQYAKYKYNAVVTLGVSLQRFMTGQQREGGDTVEPVPFVVLSTGHTHYITAGEPRIISEDDGSVKIVAPGDTIDVNRDGSVTLNTYTKEYTFRPGGKTILKEGVKIITLQEHEGPVAITAVRSFNENEYSCIVPSPSFSRKEGGYLCKVCLVADQAFEDNFIYDDKTTDTVDLLGNIIDRVSWIFRSTDWDGDGVKDNIGLDYDTQFTKWNYKSDNESEEISSEQLDLIFSTLQEIDFSGCCLGIAYTMKRFPEDIYAKQAIPQPLIPSGICTPETDELSNNLILISANRKVGNYTPMTSKELIYLTAHEVAKAFGASLDTNGELNCDSFVGEDGANQHYMLWPDVLRNPISLEEETFSPCSLQSIKTILESCKSACFDIYLQPFCGNGIIEQGEECDCGSEYDCSKQKCCFARNEESPCMKTGHPCEESSGSSAIFYNIRRMLFGVLLMILGQLFMN